MTKPARRSESSANVALLQEVWLLAFSTPDKPLNIPCGTKEEAYRMRMALYNAVRNAKKYPEDYPALFEAVDNCEVVVRSDDDTTIIVRRKALSPRMMALRQILVARGITLPEEQELVAGEKREVQASVERVMERLKADAPADLPFPPPVQPAISNPFFSRDKQ